MTNLTTYYEVKQRIHAAEINPVTRRYDYTEKVFVVTEYRLQLAKSFFDIDSKNKGLDYFEAKEVK